MGNSFDKSIPLCVDLDGTLIKGDSLIEASFDLLKRNPLRFLNSVGCLFKNIASFKEFVATSLPVCGSDFAYNTEIIDFLKQQKALGRQIILVTAADYKIAQEIAKYLQLFDQVLASDGVINLKSEAKAKLLVGKFGVKAFDYIGDSQADLAVWRVARESFLVRPDLSVIKKAEKDNNIHIKQIFGKTTGHTKDYIKAMRPHQWAKNSLVFLPLVAAHLVFEPVLLLKVFMAFLAFSFLASSVYIFNDLLDIKEDRLHPRKKKRPLADSRINPLRAVMLAVGLCFATLIIALFLPLYFGFILLGYYGLTWSYSLYLKRKALIDVFSLAGLYTMRLMAGAAAVSVEPSFWLLAFSMFMFLSLALIKRVSEMKSLSINENEILKGRGYRGDDQILLTQFGVASGFMASLVLAFYINSHSIRFSGLYYPDFLWLMCVIVCFWICRVWLLTHRGLMHDDPVVFALGDKVSLIMGSIIILLFICANG